MGRRKWHDRDWHEESLSEGPQGFIRVRGATSWSMLQSMCQQFVSDWEMLPERDRLAYAFPNPEDRRRVGSFQRM